MFAIAHVHNLTPPLWYCLVFSKTTERIVTGLEIVVRARHQRTVHHGTLCITLFGIISNLVTLSPVALMIGGKVIWLICHIRKCSITVTRSCWLSLKSFKTAWAEPQKNKTSNSTLKTFAKILSRGGLKTLFLSRTVVLSSATSFFNATLRRNRFTF